MSGSKQRRRGWCSCGKPLKTRNQTKCRDCERGRKPQKRKGSQPLGLRRTSQ